MSIVDNLLRLITGVLLVMIPGILLSLLFLRDLRLLLRISIGMVLAVVLLGWIVILLNFLKISITTLSVIIGIIIISFFEIVIIMRGHVFQKLFIKVKELRIFNVEGLISIVVLSAFLILMIIVLPLAQIHNEKGYTEFYLNDIFDLDPVWRRTLNGSEPIVINLVVKSNEKLEDSYKAIIFVDGKALLLIKLGILKPGQNISTPLTIIPTSKLIQRYDLWLFKGQGTAPYRTLRFWIRVQQ